jgi:signal transduction histidine kinase
VAVTIDDSLSGVDKPTQLAMYRIVQESLTNVVRHANATTATVTLSEADGRFVVTIRDNGTVEPHSRGHVAEGGRGLLGMRERAELLGGRLEAGRQPDGGFLVSATIPRKSHSNEESPR